MAHNPELDYEFREDKQQEKPYVFPVIDTNETNFGSSKGPKYTKAEQWTMMVQSGESKIPAKLWHNVLLVVGGLVLGAVLMYALLAIVGGGTP